MLRTFGMLVLGMCGFAASVRAEDGGVITPSAETAILRNPGPPRGGAADANVVVVEYFDYNCGYCKKLEPAMVALLETDRKVALVYKEWPILSETSKYAAESALAAVWQGRYPQAHSALMHAPHFNSHAQVDSVLQAAGVDIELLQKDRASHGAEIKALLLRNNSEASALGIPGTPGLLVGRHDTYNAFDLAALQQAVAVARREP